MNIKYEDGSSCASVHPSEKEKLTFRLNSYEKLWHLHQTVDAFNNIGITPTITILNLIDARADERFYDNESFGLKLVCKFLNSMKANFKIFNPYNPEVVKALMDNVEIIDNGGFIARVLPSIATPNNSKNGAYSDVVLLLIDHDRFKPLVELLGKVDWKGEIISNSKAIVYENKEPNLIQQIDREDFQGKDVIIVHDICEYGSKFRVLAKMLRERNCGKLYLAVSHMTLQNLGENPITNYFDKVFTTNSKYDNYIYKIRDKNDSLLDVLEQPENLKVINLFK
jgi:ribose-phosphate pyrophosphokinase